LLTPTFKLKRNEAAVSASLSLFHCHDACEWANETVFFLLCGISIYLQKHYRAVIDKMYEEIENGKGSAKL
jgi:hypothetical protein